MYIRVWLFVCCLISWSSSCVFVHNTLLCLCSAINKFAYGYMYTYVCMYICVHNSVFINTAIFKFVALSPLRKFCLNSIYSGWSHIEICRYNSSISFLFQYATQRNWQRSSYSYYYHIRICSITRRLNITIHLYCWFWQWVAR